MKHQSFLLAIALIAPSFLSLTSVNEQWLSEKQKGYTLYYNPQDKEDIEDYKVYFERGTESVKDFFQNSFKTDFSIYVHPSRASLDSTWQKDWSMPDFNSQCWMVASGVADKLDIISPVMWDSLACEHAYFDTLATQNLITHELVHVFHGQQNKSPDFSDVTGIDWFVEGLATYASGQCDSIRIEEVKEALGRNEIPESLDKFWTGSLRYGLSGSLVMYLDNRYGREQLTGLLNHNTLTDLFSSLETTEAEMLIGWKDYMKGL